jgi:site-specific DNA-methyltransferase (adenine-specific)
MRVLQAMDTGNSLVPNDDLLIEGDNLDVLKALPEAFFDLIYIDPPFNTGHAQKRQTIAVEADEGGERVGFGGKRYSQRLLQARSYDDSFDDYLNFIGPRLEQAQRLLAAHGSLYLHLDWHESHYCKLLLDGVFGRANFLNEIIWAYDYGGRSRRKWPAKHDTILVYVKDINSYHFDDSEVERLPYLAPSLVTKEKRDRGKRLTDVWFITIVPTNSREKTGYPTQKPERLLKRIVQASSQPGGWCLDFFAGSGTLGAVAKKCGRHFVLIDSNPEAIAISKARIKEIKV